MTQSMDLSRCLQSSNGPGAMTCAALLKDKSVYRTRTFRLEGIALGLEAIASRLEVITIRWTIVGLSKPPAQTKANMGEQCSCPSSCRFLWASPVSLLPVGMAQGALVRVRLASSFKGLHPAGPLPSESLMFSESLGEILYRMMSLRISK